MRAMDKMAVATLSEDSTVGGGLRPQPSTQTHPAVGGVLSLDWTTYTGLRPMPSIQPTFPRFPVREPCGCLSRLMRKWQLFSYIFAPACSAMGKYMPFAFSQPAPETVTAPDPITKVSSFCVVSPSAPMDRTMVGVWPVLER